MLIQRDERLSRATPPRRAAARDGWSRRGPRDWQKPVKLALYALLGLLGTVAALACVALLLDRPATRPRPEPAPVATASVPPRPAAPVPAAQSPAAQSPAAPLAAAPVPAAPEHSDFDKLQAQIREATAMLAALRAQTEQSRRDAGTANRRPPQAQAAPLPVPPAPPLPPAASPAPLQAVPPPDHAAGWADAERTVQALAGRAATPPPSMARQPAHDPLDDDVAVPPMKPPLFDPQPAAGAPGALQPARVSPGQRPRVFLQYRAGSLAGQQAATDIAQRLLFSDFLYADTRIAADVPSRPSVRFFYPEDAAMAARLAALLGGTGQDFQVQDFSNRRGRATRGTLEVWLPV